MNFGKLLGTLIVAFIGGWAGLGSASVCQLEE